MIPSPTLKQSQATAKPWHQSKNLRTLAAIGAAASICIAMSPAKAIPWAFSFCGMFAGDPIDSGTIDGFLSIETDTNKVVNFEAVTTKPSGQYSGIINWSLSDFKQFEDQPANTDKNPNAAPAVSFEFQKPGTTNYLYINIPKSYYLDGFPPIGTEIDPWSMAEFRGLLIRKDPDKLRIIPTPAPLPILGFAAALRIKRRARSLSKRSHTS